MSLHVTHDGIALIARPDGSLYWPDGATLFVADLHFGKGDALARRGLPLPPFDTRATLEKLDRAVRDSAAAAVIALGDSFHDMAASRTLDQADRDRLAALTARVDWGWLLGNHDPEPPVGVGGRVVRDGPHGPFFLRHEATDAPWTGLELSGHFHPKTRVPTAHRRVPKPCFAAGPGRIVLPAFGAFTGGLDIADPAIARLFPSGCEAWVPAGQRVLRFDGAALGVTPPPAPR